MSGGCFNYHQYKITEIAEEVEQLILNNDCKDLDEWGSMKGAGYAPETIAKFKTGLELLRKAYIYAQRIDCLVGGDDGEASFHNRLKTELDKPTHD